eukprot:3876606-Rhodomonas_salina.1
MLRATLCYAICYPLPCYLLRYVLRSRCSYVLRPRCAKCGTDEFKCGTRGGLRLEVDEDEDEDEGGRGGGGKGAWRGGEGGTWRVPAGARGYDAAYVARVRYGVPGTELAYCATQRGTGLGHVATKRGTEIAYGATKRGTELTYSATKRGTELFKRGTEVGYGASKRGTEVGHGGGRLGTPKSLARSAPLCAYAPDTPRAVLS